MNRLPSRANLLICCVEITSARCVLCDLVNEVETVEHCLLLCPKAKLVWSKIWSWWRISSTPDTSLRDIILGKVDSTESKLVSKALHGVCYVALWSIWHLRNRILHAPHMMWTLSHKKTLSHLYKDFLFFEFSIDVLVPTLGGADGFRILMEQ